jgi:hypothetical protein
MPFIQFRLLSTNLTPQVTDKKREWAYDRQSEIGKLDKGLDKAAENKWTIVDMRKDWKVIYPEPIKPN